MPLKNVRTAKHNPIQKTHSGIDDREINFPATTAPKAYLLISRKYLLAFSFCLFVNLTV